MCSLLLHPISPFSSLSCKCNVLFPILASCHCLAYKHKGHNFQDAQLATCSYWQKETLFQGIYDLAAPKIANPNMLGEFFGPQAPYKNKKSFQLLLELDQCVFVYCQCQMENMIAYLGIFNLIYLFVQDGLHSLQPVILVILLRRTSHSRSTIFLLQVWISPVEDMLGQCMIDHVLPLVLQQETSQHSYNIMVCSFQDCALIECTN